MSLKSRGTAGGKSAGETEVQKQNRRGFKCIKVFDEDLCNIIPTLDRKIDDSELALRLPFNLSIRKGVSAHQILSNFLPTMVQR